MSHLLNMLSQCSELMNTVEWVRESLRRCPGVLRLERHCRFKSISHPFVNEDSELDVTKAAKLTLPKRTRHQEILDLKSTQTKAYINLILEHSFTSDNASDTAREAA